MRRAKGCIEEIYLDGTHAARLSCPTSLIPAPGQYLLACAENDQAAALATPIFQAGQAPAGFLIAPPVSDFWYPGQTLELRGPFGHGFNLPVSARRVALIDFADNSARLLALLPVILAQKAAVILLSDNPPAGLPPAIEISPLSALPETAAWADYLAIDLPRTSLDIVLPLLNPQSYNYAQALISTPLPCAGVADCGVCSIRTRHGYRLACKEGPVFNLNELRNVSMERL